MRGGVELFNAEKGLKLIDVTSIKSVKRVLCHTGACLGGKVPGRDEHHPFTRGR